MSNSYVKKILTCSVVLTYASIEVRALLLKQHESEDPSKDLHEQPVREHPDLERQMSEDPAVEVPSGDEENAYTSNPFTALKRRSETALKRASKLFSTERVISKEQIIIEQHASALVGILKNSPKFASLIEGGFVDGAEFYDRDESRTTFFHNPERISVKGNVGRVVETPSLFVMIKRYIENETDLPDGIAGSWASPFDMGFQANWSDLYLTGENLFQHGDTTMEKTYADLDATQKAWFDLISYVLLNMASNAQTRTLDMLEAESYGERSGMFKAHGMSAVDGDGYSAFLNYSAPTSLLRKVRYITYEASTTFSKAELKAAGILPSDEDLIDVAAKLKDLSFSNLMALCELFFCDRGQIDPFFRGQMAFVGPSAWEEKVVNWIESTADRSAALDKSSQMQQLMMRDLGITTPPAEQPGAEKKTMVVELNRQLVTLPEEVIRWIRAQISGSEEGLEKFPVNSSSKAPADTGLSKALKKKQKIVLEMANRLQPVMDVVDRLLNSERDFKEELFDCVTSKMLTQEIVSAFAREVQVMKVEEVNKRSAELHSKLQVMSLNKKDSPENYAEVKAHICELIKTISSGSRAADPI